MNGKTNFVQKRNWLTLVGLLLLLISISIWALWISTYSVNPSAPLDEKENLFLSFFPKFLRNNASTSLIVLVSSIGSIVCSILGKRNATRTYRDLGKVVIIIACLILFLQLFSML
jgi:hypothetical protein